MFYKVRSGLAEILTSYEGLQYPAEWCHHDHGRSGDCLNKPGEGGPQPPTGEGKQHHNGQLGE